MIIADQFIDSLGGFGVAPAVDLGDEVDAFAGVALIAEIIPIALAIVEAETVTAAACGAGLVLTVQGCRRDAKEREDFAPATVGSVQGLRGQVIAIAEGRGLRLRIVGEPIVGEIPLPMRESVV
jgi:hypothetical protein